MLSVFNDDFLKFSSGNNLFYTQQDHYIHFPLVVTVCGSKIWFSWTLFVRPLCTIALSQGWHTENRSFNHPPKKLLVKISFQIICYMLCDRPTPFPIPLVPKFLYFLKEKKNSRG